MQKKLLTNGNVFKRTDGRWCGVIWYMDEQGERKRKSFSGTTKQVTKFSTVEQTTYDRLECTAKNQVYPLLGHKVVGDIVATDIKNMLNTLMNKGLAYSTVKKSYVLLNEYFRTMYLEEMINKNPMDNVEMIKKANF